VTRERRDSSRDRSFARILIRLEGRVGYVADVSDNGFKGLFPEPFAIEPGKTFSVGVSFAELGLSAFELEATVRWVRLSAGAQEVGFELGEMAEAARDESKFAIIRDYYSNSGARST
jgi:hypothetical protein